MTTGTKTTALILILTFMVAVPAHANNSDNLKMKDRIIDTLKEVIWDKKLDTCTRESCLDKGITVDHPACNIMIGIRAGKSLTTGRCNLLIGNGADVPTPSTSNFVNIGNTYCFEMWTGRKLKCPVYEGMGYSVHPSSTQ